MYTDTSTHRRPNTHRQFYVQTVLHTDAHTHRPFNRTNHICKKPSVLQIEAHFLRRGFHWTSQSCNFISVFDDRLSFRAKVLPLDKPKSQLYLNFWRSTLISCKKGCRGGCDLQLYHSFCRPTLISCDWVGFPGTRLALPPGWLEKRKEREREREREDVKMVT